MIATNDRRMQILEALIVRKQDTMENLASEFGVSRMTIYRDIQVLSCSYPITAHKGGAGGVRIDDGYRLGMKYLNEQQSLLLKKLSENLSGDELSIMQSILKTFSNPRDKSGQ